MGRSAVAGARGRRSEYAAQHGGAQAPKHTLLQNPLYRGEIADRGERYPGQHEAIIDAATWTTVQAQLALNRHARRIGSNVMASNLLAGLLFDEAGERLVPSQANKQGARYGYCISHRLKTSSAIAVTPGTSSPIGLISIGLRDWSRRP